MEPLTPAQRLRGLCLSLLVVTAVVMASGQGFQLPWINLPLINAPGPRTVVIVHEVQDQTPAMDRLITELRDGEPAKYFAEKGHKLLILDEQQKDENNQPAPDLMKWHEALEGMKPPVLIVAAGDRVLHRQSFSPESFTGAKAVEVVKANGG